MGHSHGGDKQSVRVHARARMLLLVLIIPLLTATALGLVVLWPADANPPTPDFMGGALTLADASVVKVERRVCGGAPDDPFAGADQVFCQSASVKLSSRRGGGAGAETGKVVDIEVSQGADSPVLHNGDKIVVGRAGSGEGDDGGWYFSDFQRRGPLMALAVFFAVAVVILARWRGLFALAGLAVSFGVLVRFILPAILLGKNPVAVAVVGSAAIMFVALYLAHGINARTTTAVLGTVGALFLTGVLAWIFVAGTHLTGLASEESGLLAASISGVSLKGLLLGGIVIGSLGVLDDVTVTQASAVWELHRANPAYGFSRLYAAGLRIGRDHIASTVNTLVMAYAGASLPLLVLFTLSSRRLSDVLTSEIVAQELVRTLVGSIGLISAVPITTALAAFVADRSIHREPVDALLHDYEEGSASHAPASSVKRPARRRRSSMPPPEAPKARPRTKVPRGAAGRATP